MIMMLIESFNSKAALVEQYVLRLWGIDVGSCSGCTVRL